MSLGDVFDVSSCIAAAGDESGGVGFRIEGQRMGTNTLSLKMFASLKKSLILD